MWQEHTQNGAGLTYSPNPNWNPFKNCLPYNPAKIRPQEIVYPRSRKRRCLDAAVPVTRSPFSSCFPSTDWSAHVRVAMSLQPWDLFVRHTIPATIVVTKLTSGTQHWSVVLAGDMKSIRTSRFVLRKQNSLPCRTTIGSLCDNCFYKRVFISFWRLTTIENTRFIRFYSIQSDEFYSDQSI